jgi:hypothetical protein
MFINNYTILHADHMGARLSFVLPALGSAIHLVALEWQNSHPPCKLSEAEELRKHTIPRTLSKHLSSVYLTCSMRLSDPGLFLHTFSLYEGEFGTEWKVENVP